MAPNIRQPSNEYIMSRSLLVALASVLTVAACAPAVTKDGNTSVAETGRRCAFTDTVQGYTVKDDTVYMRAGSRVYQLETAGFCPDVDTGIALGFKPLMGSTQICNGDWVDLIVPSPSSASIPCRAKVEKVLTREEIEALPKNLRP